MKTAQELMKEVAEKRINQLNELNKRVIERNTAEINRYRKIATGSR